MTEETAAACARRKSARARELLDAEKPLAPECVPVLQSLAGRYQLALASSGSRTGVQAFLDHTGLERIFRSVLSGDDVLKAKPHPEIFERSIHALGLEAARCVAIEDAAAGVQAARSAGARVIGMGRERAGELASAGAERVVGSLRELATVLQVL